MPNNSIASPVLSSEVLYFTYLHFFQVKKTNKKLRPTLDIPSGKDTNLSTEVDHAQQIEQVTREVILLRFQ